MAWRCPQQSKKVVPGWRNQRILARRVSNCIQVRPICRGLLYPVSGRKSGRAESFHCRHDSRDDKHIVHPPLRDSSSWDTKLHFDKQWSSSRKYKPAGENIVSIRWSFPRASSKGDKEAPNKHNGLCDILDDVKNGPWRMMIFNVIAEQL